MDLSRLGVRTKLLREAIDDGFGEDVSSSLPLSEELR